MSGPDWQPYDEEWRNFMLQRPKQELVDMLRMVCKERDIHMALKDADRPDLRQQLALAQADSRRLRVALEKQACSTAYYNGHSDAYKQHPNGGLFWQNYLCQEARQAIDQAAAGEKPPDYPLQQFLHPKPPFTQS